MAGTGITVTNQPSFTLRPPTQDDIPAVVAMLNACWLDTLGTPAFSAEAMHAQWTRPGIDPKPMFVLRWTRPASSAIVLSTVRRPM